MQKHLERPGVTDVFMSVLKTQGQISNIVNNFFYFWQPICTDDAISSLSLSTTNNLHE
jgi:hypothetical protein